MKLRTAATGLLASAAILAIAVPAAANASTVTSGSPGFLVSPVKASGPQPIQIENLDSVPHRYQLAEVQTQMYKRNLCGPTNRPSDVLAIGGTVTVPARKTVSVPVRVAHAPQTITDVAVRVTQDPGKQIGIGISVASYAQEIVGRGTASGCSVIRGDYAQKHPNASQRVASSSPFPLTTIVIAVLAVMAVALAGRLIFGRRRKGTHAA